MKSNRDSVEAVNGNSSRDGSAVVSISETNDLQTSGSLRVYRDKFLNCFGISAYHTIDFLRIFFVTTALMSEWLRQLFEILAKYDRAPSEEIQKTWLGFCILGAAILLSITVKTANHFLSHDTYFAAQDKYLFPIFSSSYIFFILQLFINENNLKNMSLIWFAVISAIGVLGATAFSLKLATPHSSDRFLVRLQDLEQLNVSRFPEASNEERIINGLSTLKTTACSFATLACTIGREVQGKTEPLPGWINALLALFMPIAGKIGFELTHHPKFYHGYFGSIKCIEDAALTYQTLSGIFALIIAYTCSDRTVCLDNASREVLSCLCFFISLSIGLYSVATTRIDFHHKHQSIEEFIDTRNRVVASTRMGCSTAFSRAKESASAYCSFLASKISSFFGNTNEQYVLVPDSPRSTRNEI